MSSESELKVIFTGENRLSGVVGRVEGSLGRLKGLALGAGKALAGLGALGTAALAGISVKAIGLAADAEEMESKFNVVFGNLGGPVRKELDAFASAAGRSRFELQGMAAEFGDILKPIGFTRDEAAELSVDMTKLATDLSSFNNMSMDEALRRLQGGLIGSHENLVKFGVIINESVLEQELMRMGMDDLEGQALELAKVQARWNLILAGTTDAQGDAIDTADSFTNKVRGLKNAFNDFLTELGQRLMPIAEPFVDWATEVVDTWGPRLIEFTEKWAQRTLDFLQRVDWQPFVEGARSLFEGDFGGAWDSFTLGMVNVLDALGVSDQGQRNFTNFSANVKNLATSLLEGDFMAAWGDFVNIGTDFLKTLGASDDQLEAWTGFNTHLFVMKGHLEDGDWIAAFKELGPAVDDLGRAIGIREENLDTFKIALGTIGGLILLPKIASGISLLVGIGQLAGSVVSLGTAIVGAAPALFVLAAGFAAINVELAVLGTNWEELQTTVGQLVGIGQAARESPRVVEREVLGFLNQWAFDLGLSSTPAPRGRDRGSQGGGGGGFGGETNITYNITASQVNVPGPDGDAQEAFLGGTGP